VGEHHRPRAFEIENIAIDRKPAIGRKLATLATEGDFFWVMRSYDELSSDGTAVSIESPRSLQAARKPVTEGVPVEGPMCPASCFLLNATRKHFSPALLELISLPVVKYDNAATAFSKNLIIDFDVLPHLPFFGLTFGISRGG
jgi:hypothetical protein